MLIFEHPIFQRIMSQIWQLLLYFLALGNYPTCCRVGVEYIAREYIFSNQRIFNRNSSAKFANFPIISIVSVCFGKPTEGIKEDCPIREFGGFLTRLCGTRQEEHEIIKEFQCLGSKRRFIARAYLKVNQWR